MRVLVISSTAWDVSNSFGNTFSNLFSGMDGVELYSISCRNGVNNNDVVKDAIQSTDKSLLKSIYKIGYDPFWKMEDNSRKTENKDLSENALKKRKPIHFLVRDMIWKMGKFQKSKTLNEFLERVKPDLIYLPIYSQHYMCDFQSYIIEKLNVPVVGHISDDVYGIKPNVRGLEKIRAKKLQKKIEKIIKKCSYLEVFAENMADEYSKRFGVSCYLIGKGVKAEELPENIGFVKKEKLKFVYTGVLSKYRFDTLIDLGEALTAISKDVIEIDVYSQTILTDEMKGEIDKYPSINFKGKITREEVDTVQKEGDLLIHIEGFDPIAIYSSSMSFSTKLIDYMMKGKVVFAIGSEKINSIKVLSDKNLAIVAKSKSEIRNRLEEITNGKTDFDKILHNVKSYLTTERNIDVIQKGIKERLENVVGN